MARRRLDATEYTVGWICALPIELAAAQVMLDEEHLLPDGVDSAQYTVGRIGCHNVVLACLPAGQMGIGPAAFSAGQVRPRFPSLRFGLMVGIGGGVPSTADVRLGDVVVSQPVQQHSGVVQYDFGKTEQGGQFRRTGSLNAPPGELLSAVAQLRAHGYQNSKDESPLATHLSAFDKHSNFSRAKAGPDVLFEATYQHNGEPTCDGCSKGSVIHRRPRRDGEEVTIHYGTIASGNQVIKDATSRDQLSSDLGGVLCFEMEAAGLMNDFPCLVIRGICDYADAHKNKAWQPYAASTAAACAKAILAYVPVAEALKSGKASKYRIPFSLKGVPAGRFAERPKDTEALQRALLPQDNSRQRRLLVASGLGGVGKTQLAVNFARQYEDQFSSVLWLAGNSESSLKQSFATFASRIPAGQIPERSRSYAAGQSGNIDEVVKDVLSWLSMADNSGWLLVIDNVDQDNRQRDEGTGAYDVEDYLPESDHGSVLITTRLRHLGQLGQMWEVRNVDKQQARSILEKWYGKSVGQEADALLDQLDGLPLALAQAAAYMNEAGTSFDTYTRLYKEQWQELMKPRDGKHVPLRSYANGSVATTWTISYMAIRKNNEAAANLLLLWAHLDNKDLWHGLFSRASHDLKEKAAEWITPVLGEMASSEIKFVEAIKTLRSYSLVEEAGDLSYSTHPVVHQWALHMQDERQQTVLSRLAIVLVGWAVPNDDEKTYWQVQMRLLPHADWCEKYVGRVLSQWEAENKASDQEKNKPIFLDALRCLGDLYCDQGELKKAEVMLLLALEGQNEVLGKYHVSTLGTCNSLGILYKDWGKLDQAEEMYTQALEKQKKVLGDDYRYTLNTLYNLGVLYSEQEKLDKAEEMYMRALEGKKKVLGEDHLSTLKTVHNLGDLYDEQGKLDKAEEMYMQALGGFKEVLGVDHLSTLTTVHSLGNLYVEQGKLDKAEEMYMLALQGKKKVLGEDHLSTLKTVHTLGSLYVEQGKLDKAEEMYLQALEGQKKVLGEDHLSVLGTVQNLGNLYNEQGKLDKAEEMYMQALEGRKKVLGEDYIDTLKSMHGLGAVYYKQGKLDKAEEMYRRALSGYEKAVRPKSMSTFFPALEVWWNLGLLFQNLGRVGDARHWTTKALSGYEKLHGTEHPDCQELRDRLSALDGMEDRIRENNTEESDVATNSSNEEDQEIDSDVQVEATAQDVVPGPPVLESAQAQSVPTSRRRRLLQKLHLKRA